MLKKDEEIFCYFVCYIIQSQTMALVLVKRIHSSGIDTIGNFHKFNLFSIS